MMHESHLSDERLMLDIDGELSKREEGEVRAHLGACWRCRARRGELERAIADFVDVHQADFDEEVPPAEGPRALLKAQLAELSGRSPAPRSTWFLLNWGAASVAGVFLIVWLSVAPHPFWRRPVHEAAIVTLPDARFTPGATVLTSRLAVCAEPDTKNKSVPVALQKKVFDEYGITDANPADYEVDYLVTPALGGADDIHNLWPHSYAATPWNARVKDELEDRLRDMVCGGRLELTAAQQEIASNWIAAYKKYFNTDRPLPERCAKCVR